MLRDFANNNLEISATKWTSPGGDCKLFEDNEFSIRWYATKNTITIKGKRANEIKETFVRAIKNKEKLDLNERESKWRTLTNIRLRTSKD